MEEAVTCIVCSEVYQKGPRDPLVLPCGHTFCRSCVTSVVKTGNALCPTCRSQHQDVEVEDLLINFSLLSLSSTFKEFLCDICSKHGDELKYWCRECKVALCSLCLYTDHQNGHHVHLAKAYIQERKSQLKDHIKLIIDKNVAKKKEEIRNVFFNSSRNIITLCQKSTFLHDFEKDMKLLSSEIEKVCSLDSLFVSEAKVKHIEMNKLNSLLSRNESTEDSEDECVAFEDAAEGKTEADEAAEGKTEADEAAEGKTEADEAAEGKTEADEAAEGKTEADEAAEGKTEADEAEEGETEDDEAAEGETEDDEAAEGETEDDEAAEGETEDDEAAEGETRQCLKLECRDGRLLVHSLAQRVDTHLFVQITSEVFLELSVGGRSLGRVYIQLKPRLRHSQQFMLLCLGTMGPSFVGSSISSVNHKNGLNENIVVNSYTDRITSGNTNLLTSLDSDCDINTVWEGSVTSVDLGLNKFGFMIWTKGHKVEYCPSRGYNYYEVDAVCNDHFPFGEISSGMEVVLAAIAHNPITQVTITGCGHVENNW
ncbi:uncharacterized protein [Procambarus clarkii]|uniref:uncharacterized protein n=1 Tax=Procambarus clarkii TaxID=6728 RepID=UPI001E6731DE|nr:tripartite motif-containing protein 54-like [Procambarus clarkii]